MVMDGSKRERKGKLGYGLYITKRRRSRLRSAVPICLFLFLSLLVLVLFHALTANLQACTVCITFHLRILFPMPTYHGLSHLILKRQKSPDLDKIYENNFIHLFDGFFKIRYVLIDVIIHNIK